MFGQPTWRQRAEKAEKAAKELHTALGETLEAMQAQPVLTGIERDGRFNRFTFTRNGQSFTIETMGTWDDDPAQWRKDLLE